MPEHVIGQIARKLVEYSTQRRRLKKILLKCQTPKLMPPPHVTLVAGAHVTLIAGAQVTLVAGAVTLFLVDPINMEFAVLAPLIIFIILEKNRHSFRRDAIGIAECFSDAFD
jgi:hypothetical protein